jgi:hypothetical protein
MCPQFSNNIIKRKRKQNLKKEKEKNINYKN